MTTITLDDYYRGRDKQYWTDLTPTIKSNAQRTVTAVNAFLATLERAGVKLWVDPKTGSVVSSGWRPPAINAAVPNAAVHSLMTAEACDIYDPEGEIDDWCLNNLDTLRNVLGLCMEHPSATKGWCHVQIRPPKSGKTCFYP